MSRGALFARLLRVADVRSAVEALKPLRSDYEYATAIKALGRARLSEAALSLLRENKSVQAYNAAIVACPRHALKLLREIDGDVVTYTAAMRACDSKAAEELLNEMSTKFALDVVAFNAAINACRRDPLRALGIFERVANPNKGTFAAVLASLGGPHWKEALRIVGDMRRRGLESRQAYGAAIHACEKAGELDAVLSLMTDPDVDMRNSALRLLAEKDPRRALDWFDQIDRPNAGSFVPALKACAACKDGARARSLLVEMRRFYEPSTLAFYHAMVACDKDALQVYADMRAHGTPLNAQCRRLVLTFCDAREALRIVDVKDSKSVDLATAACCRDGLWKEARGLLGLAHTRGHFGSTASYARVVAACEKHGQHDLARTTLFECPELYAMCWRDGLLDLAPLRQFENFDPLARSVLRLAIKDIRAPPAVRYAHDPNRDLLIRGAPSTVLDMLRREENLVCVQEHPTLVRIAAASWKRR